MLQFEKTKEKFGYDVKNLTDGSKKTVCVNCDYCKQDYECQYKNRNVGYKKFPKDSCSKCKFKKREEVSLKLHGVKNSAQRKEVREKISSISSERLKSEEYKTHIKNKMIEKYGVDSYLKCEKNKKIRKDSLIEKYGVDNIMKVNEIAKDVAKKSIETKKKNGSIRLFEGKTYPELAKRKGYSRSGFDLLVKKFGIDEALRKEKSETSIEKAISDLLDKNNIQYIKQYRLENRIADFLIKDVVFEANGCYFHGDNFLEKHYHRDKMILYKKYNYKPLFIGSDEIEKKIDIVESILLNKLNLTPNRLFARKCTIKEIPRKEARQFFTENHLMGPGQGDTIGLYYKDKIVMAAQFKNLGQGKWDLSRICPALNTSVIGGYSKILKRFEERKPSYLRNFTDLRYGSGEYLTDFGFTKSTCYLSFKWTNGNECFSRMKFPGNSGYEKGLFKIWDCGQQKWEKFY